MMRTKEIIDFLQLDCVNFIDFEITAIKPPDDLVNNCFTLLTREEEFELLFNEHKPPNVLAVIPAELKSRIKKQKQCFLLSNNPRLDFVKALHHINNKSFEPHIAKSALIDSTGIISDLVRIGDNVVIKGNINIGAGTEIYNNVVISGNVTIGKNVRIKSGTVIGQKGFNFVYDEKGFPLEFPHSGGVMIGDNVEFGALNTVVQGTLGNTVIADNVKTDDHVHIAHNVKIGKGTLLTACTEISGSVTIGERTWLGPNCSIIDHIVIGNDVTIGIGAVIIKPVPDKAIVVGNPGKIIKYKTL